MSGGIVFAQNRFISCLFDCQLHVNFCISLDLPTLKKKQRVFILPTQPMDYYNIREIPQSYHTFAVFDSHQMDDLYSDP